MLGYARPALKAPHASKNFAGPTPLVYTTLPVTYTSSEFDWWPYPSPGGSTVSGFRPDPETTEMTDTTPQSFPTTLFSPTTNVTSSSHTLFHITALPPSSPTPLSSTGSFPPFKLIYLTPAFAFFGALLGAIISNWLYGCWHRSRDCLAAQAARNQARETELRMISQEQDNLLPPSPSKYSTHGSKYTPHPVPAAWIMRKFSSMSQPSPLSTSNYPCSESNATSVHRAPSQSDDEVGPQFVQGLGPRFVHQALTTRIQHAQHESWSSPPSNPTSPIDDAYTPLPPRGLVALRKYPPANSRGKAHSREGSVITIGSSLLWPASGDDLDEDLPSSTRPLRKGKGVMDGGVDSVAPDEFLSPQDDATPLLPSPVDLNIPFEPHRDHGLPSRHKLAFPSVSVSGRDDRYRGTDTASIRMSSMHRSAPAPWPAPSQVKLKPVLRTGVSHASILPSLPGQLMSPPLAESLLLVPPSVIGAMGLHDGESPSEMAGLHWASTSDFNSHVIRRSPARRKAVPATGSVPTPGGSRMTTPESSPPSRLPPNNSPPLKEVQPVEPRSRHGTTLSPAQRHFNRLNAHAQVNAILATSWSMRGAIGASQGPTTSDTERPEDDLGGRNT